MLDVTNDLFHRCFWNDLPIRHGSRLNAKESDSFTDRIFQMSVLPKTMVKILNKHCSYSFTIKAK